MPESWKRVLNINLKSVLLCCQAVVPQMIELGGGRIVNTASTAAKVPRWEIGAYCVSKAAVLHLTRCLAMELAPHQITVNAIGPGATVTNLRQNSGVPEPAGSAETRRQSQLKGDMETFRIGVPLGRLGVAAGPGQCHCVSGVGAGQLHFRPVFVRGWAAVTVLTGVKQRRGE